jgi:hypothetical protein
MVDNNNPYDTLKYCDDYKINSPIHRKSRALSNPQYEKPITKTNNYTNGLKSNTLMNLKIYTVTWNQNGKIATMDEIKKIVQNNKKYHIYAIGSEECMRSIFKSFFITDKTEWESMIMYRFLI